MNSKQKTCCSANPSIGKVTGCGTWQQNNQKSSINIVNLNKMTKIKKKVRVASSIALMCMLLFVSACSHDAEVIDPKVDENLLAQSYSPNFQNTDLTIEDFREKGNLWSGKQVREIFSNSEYGHKPELAFALLIFDEQNNLVSNQEYNKKSLTHKEELKKFYYTDLETFKLLVKQETALPKFAKGSDETGWIYDSYQHTFHTDEEREQLSKKESISFSLKRKTTTACNECLQVGNIIWGKWSNSYVLRKYGHMAIVSQKYASYPNITMMLNNVKAVEASPPSVFEDNMGNHNWDDSTIFLRKSLSVPGITSAQRNRIVSFVQNQVGKPYELPEMWDLVGFHGDKTSQNEWYCSKLAWRAYVKVMDLDLDSDGGGIVFPVDIYYSSHVSSTNFGLA